MIVFKPPILEAAVGVGMIATAVAQAITEIVPEPAGNLLVTVLTAGGLGGVIVWGLKQILSAGLKQREDSRAADRKQREDDRAEDRAYVQRLESRQDQLMDHYKAQTEKQEEEKLFWRDKALVALEKDTAA